jgi:hypothetical protein
MTRKQLKEAAATPPVVRPEDTRPNSLTAAFPQFNEQGIFHPGMTKIEYATIQFMAAWVQAHGKIPLLNEMQELAELAMMSLNYWISGLSDVMHGEQDGEFDNKEGDLQ